MTELTVGPNNIGIGLIPCIIFNGSGSYGIIRDLHENPISAIISISEKYPIGQNQNNIVKLVFNNYKCKEKGEFFINRYKLSTTGAPVEMNVRFGANSFETYPEGKQIICYYSLWFQNSHVTTNETKIYMWVMLQNL